MKKVFALFFLCLAGSAHADPRVLFIGDSRTATGTTSNRYPALVQAARPDITHCVNSVNGRTSQQVLDAMDGAITACGNVTDVVILVGVADQLSISGTSPTATAIRVRAAAAAAESRGAEAWIVTEPPAPVVWGGVLPANWYVGATAAELYRLNGVGPSYNIIPMREKFVEIYWYTASCSSDGLHPTTVACRQKMADAVIEALP